MLTNIWRDVVFVFMGLTVCAGAVVVVVDRVAPLAGAF
jgi:hypothetical protein